MHASWRFLRNLSRHSPEKVVRHVSRLLAFNVLHGILVALGPHFMLRSHEASKPRHILEVTTLVLAVLFAIDTTLTAWLLLCITSGRRNLVCFTVATSFAGFCTWVGHTCVFCPLVLSLTYGDYGFPFFTLTYCAIAVFKALAVGVTASLMRWLRLRPSFPEALTSELRQSHESSAAREAREAP